VCGKIFCVGGAGFCMVFWVWFFVQTLFWSLFDVRFRCVST